MDAGEKKLNIDAKIKCSVFLYIYTSKEYTVHACTYLYWYLRRNALVCGTVILFSLQTTSAVYCNDDIIT